jgi:hypothetical protein
VLIWHAASINWLAIGDYGVIFLRTLDVGTSDTPLVGAYSRFGWNHPGPLLFFMLAPFVRLAGGDANGLLIGAVWINAAAAAGILAVVRPAGRTVTAISAFVVAAVILGLQPAMLMDPWNPYVVILPLLTSILAAWQSIFGQRVAMAILILSSSFAIQAHVGATLIAGTMLAIGIVGTSWQCIAKPLHRRYHIHTLAISTLLLMLCWLAPLANDVKSPSGNFSKLGEFFLSNSGENVGWEGGTRIVSRVLSLPISSMGADQLSLATELSIPWSLLALLTAGAICWRNRWQSLGALCGVALITSVLAVLSASRVSGLPYPYLFRWAWVAGAVSWIAILTVLVSVLRLKLRWARWSIVAINSVTVFLLTVCIIRGPDMAQIYSWDRAKRAYSALLEPSLLAMKSQGTGLFVFSEGADVGLVPGMLSEAGRSGVDIRVTSDSAYIYGDSRSVEAGQEDSQLVWASGADVQIFRNDPQYREVLTYDRLTSEERKLLDSIRDRKATGDKIIENEELLFLELETYSEPVVVFVKSKR